MRVRSDIAYIAPMAVFMAFTLWGASYKNYYPVAYVAKTFLVACMLVVLWRNYKKIRWTHLQWGVIVGVIGLIQWVGMEKLLMTQSWLGWTRMIKNVQGEAFHPLVYFKDMPSLMWAFISIRWLGASLVVPVMEELFWRDFAWRSIASPVDPDLQQVGEYDRGAFFIVPLIFASVHVQWLTAIVWGLLIATLLIRTRSIGACIVAHGVTNFLLGGYVLYSHYVLNKDEWYFW